MPEISTKRRRPHLLRPLRGQKTPNHFIFYDTHSRLKRRSPTETVHHFEHGTALYWRRRADAKKDREERFDFSVADMWWEWVDKHTWQGRSTWVYAYRAPSHFMTLHGLDYLYELGWRVAFCHADDRNLILRYRKKKATLLFLDFRNLFPYHLERIGKSLSLPPLESPGNNVHQGDHPTKCWRVVDIMVRGLREWIALSDSERLGGLSYTSAGQAFRAFRHRFMIHKIGIHGYPEPTEIERKAYHGGRNEAYQIGELKDGPYYMLDVNGLYPFVMRGPVPTRYLATVHDPSLSYLWDILRKHSVIAHVEVSVSRPYYPIKINGRLIWPVGRFEAYLPAPELRHALAHGHIRRCHTACIYRQARVFLGYVDHLYALRKSFRASRPPLWENIVKLLMNSLYGKFGQRTEDWKDAGYVDIPDLRSVPCYDTETDRMYTMRQTGDRIEESWGSVESFNSFAAIPATITSAGRMHLLSLIERAGWEHVFYCDTDSVLVGQVGYDRLRPLIMPDMLGALKVEEQAMRAEIRGLKDYMIGGREVLSGVGLHDTQIDQNRWRLTTWPGLRQLAAMHHSHGYLNFHRPVCLKRRYIKGFVGSDGSVRAWRFPEEEEEFSSLCPPSSRVSPSP